MQIMYGEYYAVHADWFGTTSDAEWTVDASVNYPVNRSALTFQQEFKTYLIPKPLKLMAQLELMVKAFPAMFLEEYIMKLLHMA